MISSRVRVCPVLLLYHESFPTRIIGTGIRGINILDFTSTISAPLLDDFIFNICSGYLCLLSVRIVMCHVSFGKDITISENSLSKRYSSLRLNIASIIRSAIVLPTPFSPIMIVMFLLKRISWLNVLNRFNTLMRFIVISFVFYNRNY